MTTAPALRPCPVPWCRQSLLHIGLHRTTLTSPKWHVECWGCGCVSPSHEDKAQAIAAWNARPGDAARETAITEAIQALIDAGDYFDNRADVNDGDYGVPSPNREMTLASQCDEALERLEAIRARAQMERRE